MNCFVLNKTFLFSPPACMDRTGTMASTDLGRLHRGKRGPLSAHLQTCSSPLPEVDSAEAGAKAAGKMMTKKMARRIIAFSFKMFATVYFFVHVL